MEQTQDTHTRILAVTEEELRRIILDLHDGPVQQLFAAQSQLSALQTRIAHGETISPEIYQLTFQRVSRLLTASLTEIRQFMGTFRPPDFAHQDLVDMVQGLLLHHELTTGQMVELNAMNWNTAVTIPLHVKITLYRICQEALANTYRHAQAKHQTIDLQTTPDGVILTIADDGIGFQPPPLHGPQATEREEHIGLRGMRDRVDLIGGSFQLESKRGKGTRIIVKVPHHE